MKVLKDGREYFDGEVVQLYEMKILGSAFMNEEDAAHLANGDLVTLMVTVRVGDPKFSHVRTGELKRTNSAKITDLVSFEPDEARFLYDQMGREVEGINYGIQESRTVNSVSGESVNANVYNEGTLEL